MSRVSGLLRFLWDFVVGDDWRIAAAVAAAILTTALVDNGGARAWWLLPIVVAVLLTLSVWEVARKRR